MALQQRWRDEGEPIGEPVSSYSRLAGRVVDYPNGRGRRRVRLREDITMWQVLLVIGEVLAVIVAVSLFVRGLAWYLGDSQW